MTKLPVLLAINYFMNIAATAVLVICGAAMLKGRNWGRQLWVGWMMADYIFVCVAAGMNLKRLPGIAIVLVIIVILYRPKASQYFTRQNPSRPAPPA